MTKQDIPYEEYRAASERLLTFIAQSPSSFHAVESLTQTLRAGGFAPLDAKQPWNLAPGGRYYVTVNGSALLAFTLPQQPYTGFHIVASHSDAPCFKLKEAPEMRSAEAGCTALNVEGYGGMLCAPWFDRPLSIAGRVVLDGEETLETRLVNFDRDLVSIVNLAIHMDRDANKGKAYQLQKDMLPLWCGGADVTVKAAVAQQLGVAQGDILAMDLFLYNRMAGTVWGAEGEFVSAPRLDDLECAYASVQALLNVQSRDKVCMAAVFDNEEVGSGTKQGALSTLLANTLRRINAAFGLTEEQAQMALARSFMVSADNGHAVHPNYPEKCDKTNHPRLNGGVVIKYAANQKYTTDAVSGALMRKICAAAGVPCQIFYNHSDVPGGSTLGNLSTQQVSLPTVDIGAAMLAMHSAYETGGVRDVLQLTQAMCAFYATRLTD